MITRRNLLKGFTATVLAAPFILKQEPPYLENWQDYVHVREIPEGVTGLLFVMDVHHDEPEEFDLFPQTGFVITKHAVNTCMSEHETGQWCHKFLSSFSRKVDKNIDQFELRSNQNMIAKMTRRGMGRVRVPLLAGDAMIYNHKITNVMDGPIGVLYSVEQNRYGLIRHRNFDAYGFNLV